MTVGICFGMKIRQRQCIDPLTEEWSPYEEELQDAIEILERDLKKTKKQLKHARQALGVE